MVETQSFHNEQKNLRKPSLMGTQQFFGSKKKSRFPNGQLYIALRRNKLSYFPGETLEGSIMVQQQSSFKAHELKLVFYGKEKTKFSNPVVHKILKKYPGKAHVPCKGMHRFIKIELVIQSFDKNMSGSGQKEYPFSVQLPDWLPSSLILQSDLTKFGRRELKIQYRLYAVMTPYGSNQRAFSTLFDTKRTFFITRKSGTSNKHFMHEKKVEYVNPIHNDWEINPKVKLSKTGIKAQISVDRAFYYSGDQIKIQVALDNTEGKGACRGVEVSLARNLQGDG